MCSVPRVCPVSPDMASVPNSLQCPLQPHTPSSSSSLPHSPHEVTPWPDAASHPPTHSPRGPTAMSLLSDSSFTSQAGWGRGVPPPWRGGQRGKASRAVAPLGHQPCSGPPRVPVSLGEDSDTPPGVGFIRWGHGLQWGAGRGAVSCKVTLVALAPEHCCPPRGAATSRSGMGVAGVSAGIRPPQPVAPGPTPLGDKSPVSCAGIPAHP